MNYEECCEKNSVLSLIFASIVAIMTTSLSLIIVSTIAIMATSTSFAAVGSDDELKDASNQEYEFRAPDGLQISFNVQDTPISTVLELIAKYGEHKISVSDSVKDSITIRMTGVPWRTALDTIVMQNNLSMTIRGETIFIDQKEVEL